MCMVMTYFVLIPLLFFLMHFIQYPGNWEGDFHINGTIASDYVAARSDGKHMHANRVAVPLNPNLKQAPVVFFGGNAQGMSGAAVDAMWLLGNMYNRGSNTFQFQLFTTAYRGYSPNHGWVSEAALTSDASDFLDHALNSTHGSLDGRVILCGWSMGAGVASQLAAARPESIAGVILFSPWSTLREETLNVAGPLSHLLYPWLWLSQVWNSVGAIASLPKDIPVAIVSAGHDMVIHNWEHRKVFDASKATRKWWLPVPGANHPDLNTEVNRHIDELKNWTQAAWDRVQVFAKPPGGNATSRPRPVLMSGRSRAFDVFGDAATRVNNLLLRVSDSHKLWMPRILGFSRN